MGNRNPYTSDEQDDQGRPKTSAWPPILVAIAIALFVLIINWPWVPWWWFVP